MIIFDKDLELNDFRHPGEDSKMLVCDTCMFSLYYKWMMLV